MTNNIAVSITADVAGLVSARAIMSAELKAATADLNAFAKTARTDGMTDELRTSMLASADAVAKSRAQIRLVDGELKSLAASRMVAAEATTVETVATEANTAAHVSNRAATEGLVMVHEVLSGRFSRVAGSAMIMAQSLGGAASSAAMLGLGVAAVSAGFAYLLYQEYKHEQAAAGVAEAFALTGRAAQASADGIMGETEALTELPGVSREAAQSLLEFDATHADVSSRIAYMANQLIPQYVKAFGKDGPEAVNKLKTALAELEGAPLSQAVAKFDELNRSTLNLAPAEVSAIEGMLRLGDAAGAVTRILNDLAQQGGGHIETIDDKIKDVSRDLKQATSDMDDMRRGEGGAFDPSVPMAFAVGVEQATDRVAELRGQLAALQAAAAQQKQQSQFADDVERSNQTLSGLHDNATRAKQAVAELHAEMERRRQATPNDPAVQDYYAHQPKYDQKLEQQQDPGDFHKPKAPKQPKSQMEEYRTSLAQLEDETRSSTGQWLGDLSVMDLAYWNGILQHARLGAQERAEIERTTADLTRKINGDGQRDMLEEDRAAIDAAKGNIPKLTAAWQAYVDDTTAAYGSGAQEVYRAQREMFDGLRAAAKDQTDDQVRVIEEGVEREIEAHRRLAEEQRKAAEDQKKAWHDANSEILGAESQFVSGMFSSRQSLGQLLGSIALSTAQKEITADIQYVTQKRLLMAEGQAADEASARGGLLIQMVAERQKTAAVVAGSTTQVAAKASAAGQTIAITKTTGLQELLTNAKVAASGAYKAMAGVPLIGPELGAVAAGATFAAVMALGSFDKGLDVVPTDMVAQIHAGERIVPASDNSAMIAAMQGRGGRGGDGGAGGNGGAGGLTINHSPTFNGYDDPREAAEEGYRDLTKRLAKMKRRGQI